jgi:hypothetical protein
VPVFPVSTSLQQADGEHRESIGCHRDAGRSGKREVADVVVRRLAMNASTVRMSTARSTGFRKNADQQFGLFPGSAMADSMIIGR